MAIDKKLIHFAKASNFATQLANGNINNTSIIFIDDTQQIWTHGKYFYCTDKWGGNNFSDYLDQAVKTTSSPTFAGLTITNALGVTSGGSGKNSVAINSMLYASTANVYSEVTTSAFGRSLLNSTSGVLVSGLNADKLDGFNSADFTGRIDMYSDDLNLVSNNPYIISGTWSMTHAAVIHNATSIINLHCNDSNYQNQLEAAYVGNILELYGRTKYNTWGPWSKFYHSGNSNNTSTPWSASSLTLAGSIAGATTGTFSSLLSANKLNLDNGTDTQTLTYGGHNLEIKPSSYAHAFYYLRPGYSTSGITYSTLYIQNASADSTTVFTTTHSFDRYGNATHLGYIQATTAILTNLADGYLPYHISDASGLGNSPIWTDGTNIGIGTTNPENSEGWSKVVDFLGAGNAKLMVRTSSITTGIYSHNSGYYGAPAGGIIGTKTSHPLTFITNGIAKMIIDTAGNVGIGTTVPVDKFHVNVGYTNGNILLQRGDTTVASEIGLLFKTSTDTGNYYKKAGIIFQRQETSGYARGDLVLGVDTAGDASNFQAAYGQIIIKGYGTYAGNVGFGTTTPGYKVDVVGDIRANGNLLTSGNLLVNSGKGISADSIVFTKADTTTRIMRLLNFQNSWTDNTLSSFFQMGQGSALFTGDNGNTLDRFGIVSNGTLITDSGYQSSPAPVGLLDVFSATPGHILVAYNSGNVCIGTTTSSAKFTVAGTGYFSGSVTAPSFIGALSGNATTATKTTQNIVGSCVTDQLTVQKDVTLANYVLETGSKVIVKFTNAAVASATLNVNGTGAKAIYYNGAVTTATTWAEGDIVELQYDGTQFHILYVNQDNATTKPTLAGDITGNADTVDSLHSTAFMRAIDANGYYGLAVPGGSVSTWIRTPTLGIIPYQSGGSSSLGSSSWPFNDVYATTLHGTLSGNATTASKANCLVRVNFTDVNAAMSTSDYGLSQWSAWSSNITNGISGSYNIGLSVCGVDTTIYGFQLGVKSDARTDNLYYRGWTNGSSSVWRALAFKDDSTSGNAATATNILNSGTVTLASATESNAITVTQPSYVTNQPVKLLNFQWYSDVWSLSNIRSGGTPSAGFGIYLNGSEQARFTSGGIFSSTTVNATSANINGNLYVPYLSSVRTNSSYTNYNVSSDPTQIAQSPISPFLWHDIIAFNRLTTPIFETSSDGNTFTTGTLNSNLFAHIEHQSIDVLDYTTTKSVRWTWNTGGLSYSTVSWLLLGFTYVNGTVTKTVSIDTSSDGSTWTNRHTSSGTWNAQPVWFYVNWGGDSQVRLTITYVSGGADVRLSSIRFLSSRWGDQGLGSEISYPYIWDGDKRVTFQNLVTVNGGLTSNNLLSANSNLNVTGYTDTQDATSRLRMTNSGGNCYIESGNFAWTAPAPLYLTGYSGTSTADVHILGNLNISNTLNVTGTSSFNNTIYVGNSHYGAISIELYGATPLIDFHYNNSSDDYTTRIMEYGSGLLSIMGGQGLYLGNSYVSSQSQRLYVDGATYIAGATALGSTLNVSGNSTLRGLTITNGVQSVDLTVDSSGYLSNPNGYVTASSLSGYLTNNSLVRLTATGDAGLTSTGHALQIGGDDTSNLIFDQNEIMARNAGIANTLFINYEGGLVEIGTGGLKVDGSTSLSSSLTVNGGVTFNYNVNITGEYTLNVEGPITTSSQSTFGAGLISQSDIYTYGAIYMYGDISSNAIYSSTDNTYDVGAGNLRYRNIYAASGTVSTSDEREKTPVLSLTQNEIDAAIDLSREIGTFQFLSSIDEKGIDKARHHVGMTVQRAIEIMKNHNLDPFRYGFICYDKWDEKTINGVTSPAGDRYSFRADELNSFIIRGLSYKLLGN